MRAAADRRRAERPNPLKILLIEDDPADARLVEAALTRTMGGVDLHVAPTLAVARNSIEEVQPDVVLLDLGLPDARGLDALTGLRSELYEIPVIVVSGDDDERRAIEAMEMGAQDYVLKTELTGRMLARSIRYALERKRIEKELLTAARYDPVTGLVNRSFFLGLLEYSLGRSERDERPVHVLFLDLDHFKKVNDSLGHAAGDELLRRVAGRLRRVVRNSDVVARLGGDEFMILMEDVEAGAVANVAEKVIDTMGKPFTLSGCEVFVSFSIGVAGNVGDSADAETLVKHADTAMYRAKEGGRNRVEFFTDEMNVSVRRAFDLEMRLRVGLRQRQFELYYQPIVAQGSHELITLEALLRWCPDDRVDCLPPDRFLSVLEQTGIIREVGDWAIGVACAHGRRWRSELGLDLRVAVNVSPRQIAGRDFADRLESILDRSGLPPEGLELEITEDVLLERTRGNLQTLSDVRSLGVAVAIDDFGTGYSSLGYLTSFPFDTLKIDRAFVSKLEHSRQDEVIAAGIIGMANDLGRKTVAEGVETVPQLDTLSEMGCAAAQGFLFGRPMPSDRIDELLEQLPRTADGRLQWARSSRVV